MIGDHKQCDMAITSKTIKFLSAESGHTNMPRRHDLHLDMAPSPTLFIAMMQRRRET